MLITIANNNLSSLKLNLINQMLQESNNSVILLWQAGLDNCYNAEVMQNLAASEIYILEHEAKARGIFALLPPILANFGKKCIFINLYEFIVLTERYYPQASF